MNKQTLEEYRNDLRKHCEKIRGFRRIVKDAKDKLKDIACIDSLKNQVDKELSLLLIYELKKKLPKLEKGYFIKLKYMEYEPIRIKINEDDTLNYIEYKHKNDYSLDPLWEHTRLCFKDIANELYYNTVNKLKEALNKKEHLFEDSKDGKKVNFFKNLKPIAVNAEIPVVDFGGEDGTTTEKIIVHEVVAVHEDLNYQGFEIKIKAKITEVDNKGIKTEDTKYLNLDEKDLFYADYSNNTSIAINEELYKAIEKTLSDLKEELEKLHVKSQNIKNKISDIYPAEYRKVLLLNKI